MSQRRGIHDRAAHKATDQRNAMTNALPLPDFTHERVEVVTGRRSGLFISLSLIHI